MHLLLDVRFSEDMCSVCRLLDKNLQQALNIGRKVALNLVSRYKQKNAPKSSLSHIMFKALMYISFIKKILQNRFPCKFLNRNVRIPKMHWYRIGELKSRLKTSVFGVDFNSSHRLHFR